MICFKKKKRRFPRFPSFRFCPIYRIENSETSESSLLLQVLTVMVSQELETTKRELRQKLKGFSSKDFMIWFQKQKKKFSEVSNIMFPSFLFGPLPKIKSLEISESFLLLNVINEFMSSINFDEGKLE